MLKPPVTSKISLLSLGDDGQFYKRNRSSNQLYEPAKSKDRLRTSNHISLSRKNEQIKKMIKEMNAESILTERGASNTGVELEIKK